MPYTQVTALWSGFTGAPGYTRMKFFGSLTASAASACAERMQDFFSAIAGNLPSGTQITFAEAATTHDDQGVLTGELTISPIPLAVSGSSATAYAGGSGAVVNWLTGAISNGRKVRGRTFLVPLASGFQTDGTLAAGTITALSTAANALVVGTPPLAVNIKPLVGQSGATVPVTGATVPDRAATLRSRRQ